MNKNKWSLSKVVLLLSTVFMLMILSGCGEQKQQKKAPPQIGELKIMVSPYRDAETIRTAAVPLANLLGEKLKEKGYNVNNISVRVGTSYSAVGEALSSGSADIGLISGATYTFYEDDVDVLLTILRNDISKDTDSVAIWNNGKKEYMTKKLVPYYRSVLLLGQSPKAQAVLAKIKKSGKPSWDELNDLRWSVMSPASAAGYLYPSMWLKKNYGKSITDLEHLIQSDSYTDSLSRLATGKADVAVAFSFIRIKMADVWNTDLGGKGTIWQDTGFLGITDKIYNDTVSVSKTSRIMQDEEFRKAVGECLIEIGDSEEGKKVMNPLGHKGYIWAKSSDYAEERLIQEELRKKQE